MMRGAIVLMTFMGLLGACGQTTGPSSVDAPGLDRRGVGVDQRIVGERLMTSGEYELALEAFQRAAIDDGLTAELLSAMGVANLQLGRLDQAINLFEQAIKKEPKWPGLLNNLGVALMQKGDYQRAALIFKKAVALDNGENDSIRKNLALALEKSEKNIYTALKAEEQHIEMEIKDPKRDTQFP